MIICPECGGTTEKRNIEESEKTKYRYVCSSCNWSSKMYSEGEIEKPPIRHQVKNLSMKDTVKFIKDSDMSKNLLFDFSYLCYRAKYHKDVSDFKNSINLWKHIVLSSLFKSVKLFKPVDVYIVCDSSSWRKDFFPYYKYKRAKKRKESDFDYQFFYTQMDLFIEEIRKYFPYFVIKVDKTEADDIIATFCENFNNDCINVLISSDKDFKQLYKYNNFFQFCPIEDKIIQGDNWKYELFTLCVKGDTSDGIPNIHMPDNCFHAGIRQKPIRETTIKEWYQIVKQGKNFCDTKEQIEHFKRNCKLIRFDYIPKQIKYNILNTLKLTEKEGNKMKMLAYFVNKDMKQLKDDLSQGKI